MIINTIHMFAITKYMLTKAKACNFLFRQHIFCCRYKYRFNSFWIYIQSRKLTLILNNRNNPHWLFLLCLFFCKKSEEINKDHLIGNISD